jgi:hypothetical protein
MSIRHFFGAVCALGATLSFMLYLATWFGYLPFNGVIWPFFAGHGFVFATSAISSSYMKPYYKAERVLQIPKLRPFFTDREYLSIWAVFGFMFLTLAISMARVGSSLEVGILRVFAAGWFGLLYLDSMILLRAKFPVGQLKQEKDV